MTNKRYFKITDSVQGLRTEPIIKVSTAELVDDTNIREDVIAQAIDAGVLHPDDDYDAQLLVEEISHEDFIKLKMLSPQ